MLELIGDASESVGRNGVSFSIWWGVVISAVALVGGGAEQVPCACGIVSRPHSSVSTNSPVFRIGVSH